MKPFIDTENHLEVGLAGGVNFDINELMTVELLQMLTTEAVLVSGPQEEKIRALLEDSSDLVRGAISAILFQK